MGRWVDWLAGVLVVDEAAVCSDWSAPSLPIHSLSLFYPLYSLAYSLSIFFLPSSFISFSYGRSTCRLRRFFSLRRREEYKGASCSLTRRLSRTWLTTLSRIFLFLLYVYIYIYISTTLRFLFVLFKCPSFFICRHENRITHSYNFYQFDTHHPSYTDTDIQSEEKKLLLVNFYFLIWTTSLAQPANLHGVRIVKR